MTRFFAVFAGMCAALALASDANADSLLRCGRDLVPEGASTYEVRQTCGEPAAMSERSEWRSYPRVVYVPCGSDGNARCRQVVHETVEIRVTEWTYDNGPRRFIRYATFEQDRLVSVRTGGRGHRE